MYVNNREVPCALQVTTELEISHEQPCSLGGLRSGFEVRTACVAVESPVRSVNMDGDGGCCDSALLGVTQQASSLVFGSITPVDNKKKEKKHE